MANMKWHGNRFLNELKDHEAKQLTKAAIFLQNQIKKELGNRAVSAPGEYPGLRSSDLRKSITHEVDTPKLIARVGSGLVYSRYLEKGTNRMAARPFLERTLEANRSTINRILTKKVK